MKKRLSEALCVAVVFAALFPLSAQALSLSELQEVSVLFFYGMVGFFGSVAFLLFGSGLTLYFVRLGTEHRVEGIHIMIRGVQVLFGVVWLIVLLKLIE